MRNEHSSRFGGNRCESLEHDRHQRDAGTARTLSTPRYHYHYHYQCVSSSERATGLYLIDMEQPGPLTGADGPLRATVAVPLAVKRHRAPCDARGFSLLTQVALVVLRSQPPPQGHTRNIPRQRCGSHPRPPSVRFPSSFAYLDLPLGRFRTRPVFGVNGV